ncbi:MAG: hypothetical protein RIT07_1548 [Bacteroidota bacterium]
MKLGNNLDKKPFEILFQFVFLRSIMGFNYCKKLKMSNIWVAILRVKCVDCRVN